jgi:hypothetical protein
MSICQMELYVNVFMVRFINLTIFGHQSVENTLYQVHVHVPSATDLKYLNNLLFYGHQSMVFSVF